MKPLTGKGLATLRVSDPRQSLQDQKAIIQRFLDSQGLQVAEWYQDVGSRLEAYKREGFQRLLQRVTKGDISWVVLECLDRLGFRSSAQLGAFITHFQDCGVRVFAISEGLEITDDDAYTAIIATVTGLRSNDELRARAHRSLKGRMRLFRDGEHGGGPAPYGMATICVDRLGVEVWRLEIVGPNRRLQLFPDGRRVEFNGPRNTPKKLKEQGERVLLVPSIYTERHEWVKQMFTWWATEDIHYMTIATRLNNLGVDALNGKGWSGPRVAQLLRNPAMVVGRCVGNKTSHAKVLGWSNGQEVQVERKGGRTGHLTKRDTSDYVYPAGEYEALIEPDLWQRAADKFQTNGESKRSQPSRSDQTYLGGLLVCGKCEGRMAGWRRKHGKEKLNYCCSHHRRYGRQSTCQVNRVSHTLLINLLDRYLIETQQKLELISRDPVGSLRALQMAQWSRSRDYLGTLAEMEQTLNDAGIVTHEIIDGQDYDICDIRKGYRELHESRQATLAQTIAEKEDELRGYIRNIPRLTSQLAIEMAEQEVDRLGKELSELRHQTQDLDARLTQLREAIVQATDRLRAAQEGLRRAEGRQRAECLRRVLKRIVLHFTQTTNPGPQDPTSILTQVVIEPLEGDPWTLSLTESPAYRCLAEYNPLRRVFQTAEIARLVA